MIGHTNSRTTETRMETRPVTIATQRLPLKNASQSGSFGVLKAVVARRTDNACDDRDKDVLDLIERERLDRIVCDGRHERGDNARAQQVGHHQPGNQTGETRMLPSSVIG